MARKLSLTNSVFRVGDYAYLISKLNTVGVQSIGSTDLSINQRHDAKRRARLAGKTAAIFWVPFVWSMAVSYWLDGSWLDSVVGLGVTWVHLSILCALLVTLLAVVLSLRLPDLDPEFALLVQTDGGRSQVLRGTDEPFLRNLSDLILDVMVNSTTQANFTINLDQKTVFDNRKQTSVNIGSSGDVYVASDDE